MVPLRHILHEADAFAFFSLGQHNAIFTFATPFAGSILDSISLMLVNADPSVSPTYLGRLETPKKQWLKFFTSKESPKLIT